ncbi:MAG: hypothetical protein ABII26_01185 [Pseudomonadota bacterium]
MTNQDSNEIVGLDGLQSALKEMENDLLKGRENQRKLGRWNNIFSLAIIIVFIIGLFSLYRALKSNLSTENFSNSIQSHMAEIAPVLAHSSVEVITHVSPLYMELAKKKAASIMPELMRRVGKDSEAFLNTTFQFAKEEFKRRFDRLVKEKDEEFRKAYPDLTEGQIQKIIFETEEDLQAVFIQLSSHIAKQPLPETVKVKLVAEALPKEQKHRRNLDLYSLFLQKLMLLLDYEIREGGKS